VAKKPKWKGFRSEQPSRRVLQQAHPTVEQLTITQQATAFSGPLPPPESLAEYEQISPGFADRIVTMAEKEQIHRHESETGRWDVHKKLLTRGQVFAFILSFSIGAGGFWLILNDKPIAGFVTLLGAIATVAGPFIYQMRWKKKQAAAQQAKR
jgi:uncharacterized membrane protein